MDVCMQNIYIFIYTYPFINFSVKQKFYIAHITNGQRGNSTIKENWN